jgi:hypothetical protein
MDSTLEAISTANENTLNYVTSVQERVLNAYRDFASSTKTDIPAASSWIPTPEPEATRQIVEETFTFCTKLLEANKKFALGLLESSEPVVAKATAKK